MTPSPPPPLRGCGPPVVVLGAMSDALAGLAQLEPPPSLLLLHLGAGGVRRTGDIKTSCLLAGHESSLGRGCGRRRTFGHRGPLAPVPGPVPKLLLSSPLPNETATKFPPPVCTEAGRPANNAPSNVARQPQTTLALPRQQLKPPKPRPHQPRPRYARCARRSATLTFPSCRRGAACICTAHASSAPRGLTSSPCDFLEPVSQLALGGVAACVSERRCQISSHPVPILVAFTSWPRVDRIRSKSKVASKFRPFFALTIPAGHS